MTDLKPVTSSNIKAVGYDAGSKILTIKFNDDRIYHHHGVSSTEHLALLGKGVDGHSVGKHYHRHIRGRFETTIPNDAEKS